MELAASLLLVCTLCDSSVRAALGALGVAACGGDAEAETPEPLALHKNLKIGTSNSSLELGFRPTVAGSRLSSCGYKPGPSRASPMLQLRSTVQRGRKHHRASKGLEGCPEASGFPFKALENVGCRQFGR